LHNSSGNIALPDYVFDHHSHWVTQSFDSFQANRISSSLRKSIHVEIFEDFLKIISNSCHHSFGPDENFFSYSMDSLNLLFWLRLLINFTI
jgi:hypothetical protein